MFWIWTLWKWSFEIGCENVKNAILKCYEINVLQKNFSKHDPNLEFQSWMFRNEPMPFDRSD